MKMTKAERAERAYNNLNVFAIIQRIAEGSFVFGRTAHSTADEIIRLCKREQSRQLDDYDAAKKSSKEEG